MDHVLISITPFSCSLSGAIYLSRHPVVPRLSYSQIRILHSPFNFNARNKIMYCRVGRIIRWKATCGWAVQLSRYCFLMLPVLVDLLWFDMLLVKVSVVSLLPQYLSRCLSSGVTFITWQLRIHELPLLSVQCLVCTVRGVQSCVRDWSRVLFFFFYRERACDGKELARFLACVLSPFPL